MYMCNIVLLYRRTFEGVGEATLAVCRCGYSPAYLISRIRAPEGCPATSRHRMVVLLYFVDAKLVIFLTTFSRCATFSASQMAGLVVR